MTAGEKRRRREQDDGIARIPHHLLRAHIVEPGEMRALRLLSSVHNAALDGATEFRVTRPRVTAEDVQAVSPDALRLELHGTVEIGRGAVEALGTRLTRLAELEVRSAATRIRIPDDLFDRVPGVRKLTLACTALASLPASTTRLRALEDLRLECPLDALPADMRGLASLTSLVVGTPWKTFPLDPILALPSLARLAVRGPLLDLPPGLAVLGATLTRLDLDHSHGDRLPDVAAPPSLAHLRVGACSARAIDGSLLIATGALRTLVLRDLDVLGRVPSDVFAGTLRRLVVVSCGAETLHLPERAVAALTELRVSRCRRFSGVVGNVGVLVAVQTLAFTECGRLEALPWRAIAGLRLLTRLDVRGSVSLRRPPPGDGDVLPDRVAVVGSARPRRPAAPRTPPEDRRDRTERLPR